MTGFLLRAVLAAGVRVVPPTAVTSADAAGYSMTVENSIGARKALNAPPTTPPTERQM